MKTSKSKSPVKHRYLSSKTLDKQNIVFENENFKQMQTRSNIRISRKITDLMNEKYAKKLSIKNPLIAIQQQQQSSCSNNSNSQMRTPRVSLPNLNASPIRQNTKRFPTLMSENESMYISRFMEMRRFNTLVNIHTARSKQQLY